mgnify:CR=1 FL=1
MDFIDLKAQQSKIREKIDKRIKSVLDHGKYIMGPEVFELEEKLCEYVGMKYCISCSSGTDALLIPLMAAGIGPGDAIITTPFTYIATAEVISLLKATPIFIDIYPTTFNLDPDLTSSTAQSMQNLVQTRINNFFGTDLQRFNKVFKYPFGKRQKYGKADFKKLVW